MSVESVLIDQREPSTVVDEVRAALPGIPVTTALLDTGDAWLAASDGQLVVVERKTPADLLSSIADRRLFVQALGMRALTPWSYVVVTGQLLPGTDGRVWLERRTTNWNYDAVQGSLLSVQETGVGVAFCRDGDYGGCLKRLAARGREVARVPPAREATLLSPGELLLASLPGIGVERTGALLQYCGTPALALVYLCGDGGSDPVPGIGPKTRAAVRRALGLYENTRFEIIGEEHANVQTS